MKSSYFADTPFDNPDSYDGRWSGAQGDVLVKIKRSSNVRDVRDALLALAYALAEGHSSSQALCLLSGSRLTTQRLAEELARFRFVVRPDLATRVMLAAMDDKGQPIGDFHPDAPELRVYLKELPHKTHSTGVARVSRENVQSHIASLWLQGKTSQTLATLQRDTKASHPTVAVALRDLNQQGLLHTDRKGVMLQEPGWEAWRRLAETHARKRTPVRFADPSGLSRTATDMVQRLQSLQKRGIAKGVAIGGVVGAAHYYPDLDITAPPRLDLSIFDRDTSFVRQLDAGLVQSDDKDAKVVLVIHLNPCGEHFSETFAAGRAAPPLDCLADLLEIGLTGEARAFALALNRRAQSTREAVFSQ